MPNATELVDSISTRVRENLKKGEQGTLKAVEAWTAAVEGVLPEQLVALEEKLPRPTELVAFSFEIADRAIDVQTEILKSLAGVIEPLVGGAPVTGSSNGTKPSAKTSKTTK